MLQMMVNNCAVLLLSLLLSSAKQRFPNSFALFLS